jgi:hypothetical protein
MSFAAIQIKSVRTSVLDVAYEEHGPVGASLALIRIPIAKVLSGQSSEGHMESGEEFPNYVNSAACARPSLGHNISFIG